MRRLGGILALNGASILGQGNKVVAARGKEAAGGCAADLRDGISAFIAIAKGMRHAQHGRHFNGKPADALKQILNLTTLEGEGGFIGHMLADAAAAALIDGAERFGAIRAFFEQLFDAPEGIALFGFDDAHPCAFSGKQPGNKYRDAIMAANALRILTEGFAGHFIALIFGEHGHSPF